jgi:hypothetical protein
MLALRALCFLAFLALEVPAFPPGADAGWSHIGGPWFFSEHCRTPACEVALPFEPAPGPSRQHLALYNRNIYREFQAAFECRSRSTDAGSAVGFVFARAVNGSSFLSLELSAHIAHLSRHHPDGDRERLAQVPLLPGTAGKPDRWHTVALNVSGTPGNSTAPATVRAWVDGHPLPAWVHGAALPNGKSLELPELAEYGFVGFIATNGQGTTHKPQFWLDPSDFLNVSKGSPASFAPLEHQTLQSEGSRAPIKPMSVMTFWSGGGDPCIRTKDEYVCDDYAADLRDEADWVTMRGLRDNDNRLINLNGSNYVYRKTGLSGMVTFNDLWAGALWPCKLTPLPYIEPVGIDSTQCLRLTHQSAL